MKFNNRGQGLIEYILLVALIAVGSISLLRVLNQSMNYQFAQISKALGAKTQDKLKTPEVKSTQLQKKDLGNFMSGVRNTSKKETSSDEDDE